MPRPTKVKIDDGVIHKREISSSSSSSPLALKTTYLNPPGDLITELAELGFDGSAAFIGRFGPERIRRAIARAKAHPPGKIKNLAGYIRYLVTTPGPIPEPEKPKDDREKYISGRYGHMVKR